MIERVLGQDQIQRALFNLNIEMNSVRGYTVCFQSHGHEMHKYYKINTIHSEFSTSQRALRPSSLPDVMHIERLLLYSATSMYPHLR